MCEVREVFTVITYNLWKTNGIPTAWDIRAPIVRRQLAKLRPYILLVQELAPKISLEISKALPQHAKVIENVKDEPGWDNEGNIFYDKRRFDCIQTKAFDIGQKEKDRRLFVSVLRCRETSINIIVSTAHFTWQGHKSECESSINVRKEQATRASDTLLKFSASLPYSSPILFGGDLNESFWPKRIFESKGFKDCFETLGLPVRPTHPTRPSLAHEERNADAALDWLFFWNPAETPQLRVLLSSVIKDMRGLSSDDSDEKRLLAVQPSDHMPVMSVFRLVSQKKVASQ